MKLIKNYFELNFDSGPQIKEVGLKLSNTDRQEIRKRIELLMDRLPAHSFTTLTFIKEGEKIKASLKATSTIKQFKSMLTGKSPLEVYAQLEQEIDEQLNQWKKVRFMPSSLTGGVAL